MARLSTGELLSRFYYPVIFVVGALIAALILGFAAEVYASPATISFAGSERALPRRAQWTVTKIDVVTGSIISATNSTPRARIAVDCETSACLAAISAVATVRNGNRNQVREFFGVSRAFGPLNVSSRLNVVRIVSRPAARPLSRRQIRHVQARFVPKTQRLATAPLRISLPSEGFNVTGPLASQLLPRAVAQIAITNLTKSPCYQAGADYAIVESDPRVLSARKREFDLIKSGFAANDPNFVDAYQAPNATVQGTVVSGKDGVNVTLQVVNQQGVITKTSSAQSKNVFQAIDEAAAQLAQQLCVEIDVTVTTARCELERCTCCPRNEPECKGFIINGIFSGSGRLPTGALLYASIPVDQTTVRDCGGTTVTTFLNDAVACGRTSQEQPESFGWNFRMSTPSCSCPDNSPPSVLPVVVTAKDDTSGRRADVLLLDTPCSFSD